MSFVDALPAACAALADDHGAYERARHHRNLRWLLEGMDAIGNEREVPIRVAYGMFGDRWSSLILHLLSGGRLRHTELRRLIEIVSAEHEISQRQLTLKLRLLEREGYVGRSAAAANTPRVDYALTELGSELYEHLAGLTRWLQQSTPRVLQARRRYAETYGDDDDAAAEA